MVERPLAIDCFAGAGGLSQGLTELGVDVCFAFDSDAKAVETYNHNLGQHAHQILAQDVTAAMLAEATDERQCHFVVGGPPCQGFSVQRRGSPTDIRNDLIFEFLRIVSDVQPTMFVMENVAALQGPRGKPYLDEFSRLARQEGYHLNIAVLNAADYGVPQKRKRLFVVGERTDLPLCFEFPKPIPVSERRTVRDAIGDLPSPDKNSPYSNHEPDRISDLNRQRISHVPQGGGREHIPLELRLPCHRVSVEVAGHRNVYGRLHWDEPASTITTKCNSFTRGKFAHPREDRNISMREAARIQGFPDNFAFLGDKVAVAHQIGNAVPPPLAKHLGLALLNALALKCVRQLSEVAPASSESSGVVNVRTSVGLENEPSG